MRQRGAVLVIFGIAAGIPALTGDPGSGSSAPIAIDYPADGSIFPPEITPPTFRWRDSAPDARAWQMDVDFGDGAPGLRVKAAAGRPRIGDIDPRAISTTNEPPALTPREAAAWSWAPDEGVWAAIKKRSLERPARITITGFRDKALRQQTSRGAVSIRTSKDPVGAPIFYRDVPLMPSELEKGVIKPLAQSAVPLIAWRLRYLRDPRSRLLLEGMHACANCHSFSADGGTLGMDLDGPQNDKGLYAIVPVHARTSIRNEDVISWNSFNEQPAGRMRVGFMSQVSPDGQYVVTTVGAEKDLSRNYYVANFKDYRFLQVFYATRGALAWYSRATGQRQSLPGADDPRYVQTNGVWSPDGRYIVFARAEAQDAYPEGRPMAEYANDPNEAQVKYDLYRVPFNDGKGGRAERIVGASANGMSNSFPKVSPDGRWIVFVQAKNGLLMRPDSQLYIVPAAGGAARRMNCNALPMNSWHSFSPNGRWLVFSSKRSSPYTRMYLTHIDENGEDSPAILIDNVAAANRAVNIPEFINIPQDGFLRLEAPAADFYTIFDRAWALAEKGEYKAAISQWNAALAINPNDAKAQNNLAFALARTGNLDEAIPHWRSALAANSEYAEVHRNLGIALLRKGSLEEAIARLSSAVALAPADAAAHYNLGLALLEKASPDEAIVQLEAALQLDPSDAQAHNDLGAALMQKRRPEDAIGHFTRAVELNRRFAQAYFNLGNAYYLEKRMADAVAEWRNGLRLEPDNLAVLRQAAWVLSTAPEPSVRNGGEAVKFAERAAALSGGGDPAALDTLAAAYAEAGRFADAAGTARKALALATAQTKQPLAEALKARLTLYESGAPFREEASQR
ncbi:MAG: tetratricopeptide repeat protein [Acidobacteriia bacterium]|nr:tetratricopeptide repeat protein [Terriglobia bacterium]